MRLRTRVVSSGLPFLLAVICAAQSSFVPVNDTMLQNPDPADWLMWRRTLNSWGYSPLNQINRANAAQLRMVWTRGMGPGVQEATPLVHNGILFLPNPSDLVQAINGATGDLIWEYKRKLPADVTKFLLVPEHQSESCDLRQSDHRYQR